MANYQHLILALGFAILVEVVESTRLIGSKNSRSSPQDNRFKKQPLPWWVFPLIAIIGLVVTLLILYFTKKLFAGQRTIKIRNSLRNRPRSPWITTDNRDGRSDRSSDVESRDLSINDLPPSYIEVTKDFESPPPPPYDAIFQCSAAVIDAGLMAQLPVIAIYSGSANHNGPTDERDDKTSAATEASLHTEN